MKKTAKRSRGSTEFEAQRSEATKSEETSLPTAAALVCRKLPVLAGLWHVTQSISAFADSFGSCWTLESLSRKGPKKLGEETSVRLLDRLLAQEFDGLGDAFRSRRCEAAVNQAIADDYMLVLDWWLTKYPPLTEENVLVNMITAVDNRRIHVLDWFEQEGVLRNDRRMICSQAESAYWLHERGYRLAIDIDIAIEEHDLKFLKWCRQHEQLHVVRNLEEGIVLAARANSVKIAQWLINTYPGADWEEPDGNCCFKCDLKMMIWLEDNFEWEEDKGACPHERWINYSVELSAKAGQLDIVQYFYDHPLHEPSFQHIFDAAFSGHMEIVQWLHERLPGCSERALQYAAQGGHFEIVKWLHDHMENIPQISWNHKYERLIDVAALHGSLDMVQWFHDYRPNECTTDAMNNAAWIGNLEIVQWLHLNRKEGCTAEALRRAVVKGHLDVVQWLHEYRPECLSSVYTPIMDLAAEYGHLEIVKWLHENRSEGCTVDAIDTAAEEGHLNAVKFLIENRSEGCTISAVEEAAANGHLEIIKLIFGSCLINEDATSVINYAAAYGRFDIVRWFYHNFRRLITEEAIDEATKCGHVQIVRFLHDRCNLFCTDDALAVAGRLNHFAVQEWAMKRIEGMGAMSLTTNSIDFVSLE